MNFSIDRRWVATLILIVVALAVLLPRASALDRFVTADEWAWLGRSAAFYKSLRFREFAGTFQHSHPGVTAMWAGTFTYLRRYPGLVFEAAPREFVNFHRLELLLKRQGKPAISMLASARSLMVLGTTLALALSFLAARRLLGLLAALLGLLLLALDPFHIGLTRLLHLDGLMSSLMLLAALSLLAFFYCGRRWYDLILAFLATGFAWLTKTPSIFLAFFFPLIALVQVRNGWREAGRLNWRLFWRSVWPVAVVLVGAALVFILFWPVMWVDPLGTLQKMLKTTTDYATEGHNRDLFFMGRVVEGDPGWLFYPVNYLWRASPAVLSGLALAVLAFLKRWSPLEEGHRQEIAVLLVLYALLFAGMMSLGAKKFDRYIIPSFPPLDLAAGLGWAGLLGWLWGRQKQNLWRWAAVGLAVLVVGSQAYLAGQTYPYYLTYYNPLLGGSARAPGVMMIGWGEGLDEAARYLNQKPGAEKMRVMSFYPDGSFSYIFNGETLDQPEKWQGIEPLKAGGVDYMVIYSNQLQRQLPDRAMLVYFAGQTPDHEVSIDGLRYARIYGIRR